jgi:protein-L-isoaspartate O-methyltransferase
MKRKEIPLEDAYNQSLEYRLAHKIRNDEYVLDSEFDQLYADRIRSLSIVHWTPVNVAVRVAMFATQDGQKRVLDVGSGAGKFCSIGALLSEATFVGVEQREYLVEASNELAARLNLPNARFYHMNAMDVSWAEFDSIYLFNPYSENVDPEIHIDQLCELSFGLFVKYVRDTERQLAETRSGTTVIIFNHFGGELPSDFECVHKEEINFLPLEVWKKK